MCATAANGAANGAIASPPALVALDSKKRIAFKLVEKHVLSHNVRRFRFALQSPQHKFGLPVGKHVFAYGKCVPREQAQQHTSCWQHCLGFRTAWLILQIGNALPR